MKTKLLLAASLLFGMGAVKAQWTNNGTWNYNFGTGTGTFNTVGANSSSNATTAGFLPITPAGNAGVYINSSAASGSFTLNGDNTLTEKMPTANMVRFSVNSVSTATDVVVNTFKIKFSGAITSVDAGSYLYAIGNHKGNLFNITGNNSVYRSSDELFTALRWTPTTTANSTTIKFEYRLGSDASSTTTYNVINSTTFVKGNEYEVAVYCNNSTSNQTYTVGANTYTLPSNKFHIWVDGIQINTDFPRSIEVDGGGGLAAGTSKAVAHGLPLNSFLFSANGAAGATGSITLSSPKLIYAVTTTPVSLTSFTGKKAANGITLNWATASEQHNDYFEVTRSTDGKTFAPIGTVKGKGTTNQSSRYSLTDNAPVSGTNYYQLKQYDEDGSQTTYKETVAVDYALNQEHFAVNTAQNKLNVSVYSSVEGWGELTVFDLKGEKLIQTKVQFKVGQNIFAVDAGKLTSGLLIARLTGANLNKVAKFIK